MPISYGENCNSGSISHAVQPMAKYPEERTYECRVCHDRKPARMFNSHWRNHERVYEICRACEDRQRAEDGIGRKRL